MNFSFKRLDGVRTILLVVAAGMAVVTTMGASITVRAAASSTAAMAGGTEITLPLDRVQVSKAPFVEADYKAFAEKIRVLYPEIAAQAGPNSIVLSGSTPQSYASWRLAWLSTLPKDGDYRWSLKSFCAVSCEGAYFRAEVSITKEEVIVIKG